MNTIDNYSTEIVKHKPLYLFIIGVLSVAIPIVVAVLFSVPQTGGLGDLDVSFLPKLNAVLNTSTAIALILGYYFIKKHNIQLHRLAMFAAFSLSSLFLVSYVIYHFQSVHTVFGGTGLIKTVYLSILLTHILLAIAIVPLVLLSIYFAISNQIIKHKKIVKWTFPIWLYVAVSGVIVYLMISPYYK
jgi:putative membrane protein